MKLTALTLTLFLFLVQCTPPKQQETDESNNNLSLEGSWQLVSYIPYSEGSSQWNKYSDNILYEKHLTNDHFVWIKYDKSTETLLGMGGGTYKIDSGKYIENISFFYPPGSSELGQSIPFDVELTDETWYHKGEAKIMDMDVESGEIVSIGTNKIEEKWVRTSKPSDTQNPVVGTWDLVSYLDGNQNDFVEYPNFVGYIKLITPSHFAWVYYNNEGDEIYAAGSGPYSYKDGKYAETIDMIYPENSGQLGETIEFKSEIENKKWSHAGYIPMVSIDSSNGTIQKDSVYIDEIWVSHKEKVLTQN